MHRFVCYNILYCCHRATQKTDLNAAFAYQVNPIGLRVGNDRIGGFVEAGMGHKGFLTPGVSVKF